MVAKPDDCLADEQPMGARDGCFGAAELLQLVEELDDRATGRDLVIEDDGLLAGDVADDGVDHDRVIVETLLAAGRDWKP